MEIINALGGIVFTLLLAALAVSPTAISTYLEVQEEQNASEAEA